jgi:dolichol-phosphate mannosyltransferase
MSVDLTALLPVLDERDNVAALLSRLQPILRGLGCTSEVLVVDGGSHDGTAEVARELGARVLVQRMTGYGGALREGFAAARGQFVLTLDADLSHDPDFIGKLWRARETADVVIASRYVKAGVAYMPFHRRLLSIVLNRLFASGLGLPLRDLSSGFRLYRASALAGLALHGRNFDVLEEIVVKAYAEGWRVVEVPFTYYPRDRGSSHARIFRFGLDLARAFRRLRPVRNAVEAADYDERAFYSRIPLQRYWQRRRHRLITELARGAGRTLDAGCGSSVLLQSLNNAVGLDLRANKLRYMRRYGVPLVQASVAALPFRGGSFACVVCAAVVDQVGADAPLFAEFARVLRPGGLLVITTPDYDRLPWRAIEFLYCRLGPGGYTSARITRYTRARLLEAVARHGLEIVRQTYIFGSELILEMRKPPTAPSELGAPWSQPPESTRKALA